MDLTARLCTFFFFFKAVPLWRHPRRQAHLQALADLQEHLHPLHRRRLPHLLDPEMRGLLQPPVQARLPVRGERDRLRGGSNLVRGGAAGVLEVKKYFV